MPSPEKIERNIDLVAKRDSDPNTWSFEALGNYFNIHKTTAEQIYKRAKERERKSPK